jgi:hypothetical protein
MQRRLSIGEAGRTCSPPAPRRAKSIRASHRSEYVDHLIVDRGLISHVGWEQHENRNKSAFVSEQALQLPLTDE